MDRRLAASPGHSARTVQWVAPGALARSSRPGYLSGARDPVGKSVVDGWIETAQVHGIRSIVCLLADEHLRLYASLGEDLPSYYRRHGFEVVHLPVLDYQQPPLDDATLARIADAYAVLPKAVLVHCSAGIDRTGAAIEYLQRRFDLGASTDGRGSKGANAPA